MITTRSNDIRRQPSRVLGALKRQASRLALILALVTGAWAAEPTLTPFERMDRHALAAPENVTRTPDELASYLCQPAANPWEKARVIFRWITAHIDYDIEAFANGTVCVIKPSEVLRDRKTVCAGYARLFKRLCEEAGLEAEIVSGHCREYGEPDEHLRRMYGWPIRHAWNVVKLGGQWHPVDATWGAGHIQGNRAFVRDFDPHYFLTRPVEFIHTHFPSDPKWQLLPKPIEEAMYDRLVHVRSGFFRHGLTLGNQRLMDIETSGPLTVTLGVPTNVLVFARVERGGTHLPMNRVFTQRRGAEYEIRTCLSDPGDYRLLIFSERNDEHVPDSEMQWALGYKVSVKPPAADCPDFPEVFRTFHEREVALTKPFSGALQAHAPIGFELIVPNAQDVYLRSSNGIQELDREGDRFFGTIKSPPGELIVYAQYPKEGKAWGLLRYNLE